MQPELIQDLRNRISSLAEHSERELRELKTELAKSSANLANIQTRCDQLMAALKHVFPLKLYRDNRPDLVGFEDTALVEHFVQHGIHESIAQIVSSDAITKAIERDELSSALSRLASKDPNPQQTKLGNIVDKHILAPFSSDLLHASRPNVKIFQVFHKYYPSPKCNWIFPVSAGGKTAETIDPTSMLRDNEFSPNISDLNLCFCELTVHYHAWKHYSSDYFGFYHYRRYLSFLPYEDFLAAKEQGEFSDRDRAISWLTSDEQNIALQKRLSISRVLVPKKIELHQSIKNQYLSSGESLPWQVFEQAVTHYHKIAKESLEYFNSSTRMSPCNIFVMSSDVFKLYSQDLFSILIRIFNVLGQPFDDYNNRYAGFLAERYLGFWLQLMQIEHQEVQFIANLDDLISDS